MDIPGWKAPQLSGAPRRGYLRSLGYGARGWGFGTNTGDPWRDVERLTRGVLQRVEDDGSPVSLVGWSLGGVIAGEVARRHPEAVRRVITYGTRSSAGPGSRPSSRGPTRPRRASRPVRLPSDSTPSRRSACR